MIVTDIKYHLPDKLVVKLNLMIDRCTSRSPKRDAMLILEGGEGEGKTNSSLATAYYIKHTTKRPIYLFFRLQSLIDFVKDNEEAIIIWDEPSLDSLAAEHLKKINLELTKLLMTCRKKRHFFIINMTKFFKFNEYIVVDRALGMINIYSRKGLEMGRINYIKKDKLEVLFSAYRSSKKRLYSELSAFNGMFVEVMEKHFNKMGINIVDINGKVYPNATLDIYEREKDMAIKSIGQDNKSSDKNELINLKIAISKVKAPIKTQEELAEKLGVSRMTLHRWGELSQKEHETGVRGACNDNSEPHQSIITGNKDEKKEKSAEKAEEEPERVAANLQFIVSK